MIFQRKGTPTNKMNRANDQVWDESSSRTKSMDQPLRPKRLYQVWKGNNKFLCSGRITFGPDATSLILTTILIGVPAAVFCLKTLLAFRHTDPIFGRSVFAGGVILTVLDLAFLFLTSARDPGIVPRNKRLPANEMTGENIPESMEWVTSKTQNLTIPRTKDILVNGHVVKVKFCDTCRLYRPPRASHCSICNNCVQKFDHHCPWVGQCIALRNYRFFLMFISLATVLCVYVFAFSWISILRHRASVWRSLSRDILSSALIIYSFIAVWFVGGLSFFHLYLVCTNQTTYENFRYRYDKKENPHNRGPISNIKEVFFSKIPPSKVNFREWVTEDEDPSHKPNCGVECGCANEKLEMGAEIVPEKNDSPLPFILQNLDYSGFEDKQNQEGKGDVPLDPLFSHSGSQHAQLLEKLGSSGSRNATDDCSSR